MSQNAKTKSYDLNLNSRTKDEEETQLLLHGRSRTEVRAKMFDTAELIAARSLLEVLEVREREFESKAKVLPVSPEQWRQIELSIEHQFARDFHQPFSAESIHWTFDRHGGQLVFPDLNEEYTFTISESQNPEP